MAKLKMALMGCGGMQNAHARRIDKNPDAQVVALCDVSRPNIQKLIDHSLSHLDPAPTIYTDPAQMYEQEQLDGVFISTPHTMHFEHGMAALEAGCHVFMEKPMVTSAADAHKLNEMARQSGKVFVVGYNTPCSPEFAYLRSQIRDQTLGKLELVVGHLSQSWIKPTSGSWRQKPELSGGGQAYDSGAHILNSLVWSVESNVAQVFAFVDNLGAPVDVNSSINIRFENGVMAAISIGGNCPVDGAHMAFMFDGGKIEIDPWDSGWINVYNNNGRIKYPQITGKQQSPDDNFIDAILGRAEPRTSPVNGIIQSELMDAIYESARTGTPASPKQTPPGSPS